MKWDISVGSILTALSLLLSFWLAHRANVKRLQDNKDQLTEMRIKLDMIYGWFQNNVITNVSPVTVETTKKRRRRTNGLPPSE